MKHFVPPANFWPPQTFGLATLLPAEASCQTCERIVYFWSLSCNNNMETNVHFKLRY